MRRAWKGSAPYALFPMSSSIASRSEKLFFCIHSSPALYLSEFRNHREIYSAIAPSSIGLCSRADLSVLLTHDGQYTGRHIEKHNVEKRFLIRCFIVSLLISIPASIISLTWLLPAHEMPTSHFWPYFAAGVTTFFVCIFFGCLAVNYWEQTNTKKPGALVDRETGTVKWFSANKGFGFITRPEGDDIFVHFRSIRGQGHRALIAGQRVEFKVVRGEKGLQADDVTPAAN